MRKLYVIGIGAGDPEYVTIQAVRALNAADVLFVLEKAGEQRDLLALRAEICERYIEGPFRVVTAADPPRGRGAEAVAEWRRARADLCEGLIRDSLGAGEAGAFLVWGDPSLYDGTLAMLDDIAARGNVAFEVEVIPGISAPSALAARHRIALNRVAGAVAVTTGRRVAEGLPDADDVVVMLDGQQAFREVAEKGVEIFWGAYLGTPDELLVAGPLAEVAEEIARVRADARERKGWMFDTYLLRRAV
jgi:precorrin-6A synthase